MVQMSHTCQNVLSFGADYEINKFDFGINMTYHSETYGTAEETETEESWWCKCRAGRIDSYISLNLRYAGYEINDNYKVKLVLITQQTLNILHQGIHMGQEQVHH